MSNNVKSKIIPYGFTLFSLVFVGYILVEVVQHYLTKYIL